jgi:hypothetical protein
MDPMRRKIKIFVSFQDAAALEVEINDWLSQNPNIRIIQMLQTTHNTPKGWHLVITLLYETG